MSTRKDGSFGEVAALVLHTQMIELVAAMLADADHVTAARALRNVDQKTMARLLRQEAEADDISRRDRARADHVLLAHFSGVELLICRF